MGANRQVVGAAVPALYARWLADLLPEPVPREPRATCDSCAMASPAPEAEARFDPGLKCCTFMPALPNFQVGAALADLSPERAEGRQTVVDRIALRDAVTPLGLGRTAEFTARYHANPSWFGRDARIRCPHLVSGGRCGVWSYRESTCATWFCKHERGVRSKLFWRALRGLLSELENEVALWCALELGADSTGLSRIYDGSALGSEYTQSDEAYRTLWGSWTGREHELFIAAAERVAPLAWVDVAAIAGPTLVDRLDELVDSMASLEQLEVPERVTKGDVTLVQIGETSARLCGYSAFDAQDVPIGLVAALPDVDGWTVEELRAAGGASVEEIRVLLDHEILLPWPVEGE